MDTVLGRPGSEYGDADMPRPPRGGDAGDRGSTGHPNAASPRAPDPATRRSVLEGPLPDRRSALAEGAAGLRRALSRSVKLEPGVAAAAQALSVGYRSGDVSVEPTAHVRDPRTASAYAAARMPATFAATGRALAEAAASLPAFAPRRLLDVGAGSGAAAWAAVRVWPSLDELVLVDREPAAIELGRRLAAAADLAPLAAAEWRTEPLAGASFGEADLVTAAYVLGELLESDRPLLVERLWAATRGALVLVEPGSPAGYRRIMAARSALIAAGAAIAAPCPGPRPCPVAGADWCHFLVRLERSVLHREAKAASRSWEDEPFSYVVVTRLPADPAARVVLGRPRSRPGRVEVRICAADGRIQREVVSRREGPRYRAARDLAWGDRVPGIVADGLAAASDPDESEAAAGPGPGPS